LFLFSIHSIPQSLQHSTCEEPNAVSPQQNEHGIYDLAEDGDSASKLYAQMKEQPLQHQFVSDQCDVYDKLTPNSVEDPAECYSKLDRDKYIGHLQQQPVSDQCDVYDKLATSSVEDPADCYSKLDRDKHIENTADVYAVVNKNV